MRYRKRPIEVEAIQYTGDNYKEICDFCQCTVSRYDSESKDLLVDIPGSLSYLAVNDYIYKGEYGIHTCYCKVFEDLYEPIPEGEFKTPYSSKTIEKTNSTFR